MNILNFFNIDSSYTDYNYLIIIEGQSNAVGSYTGAPKESYLLSQFQNVYMWGTDSFSKLQYGVNSKGYRPTIDHGSELNIGYILSNYYNNNIYILKNTSGGKNIDYFINNATYTNSENAAITYLLGLGKPIKIIYHYNQGEANANNTQSAFYNKLVTLRDYKRNNLIGGSDIRFITCRISSNSMYGGGGAVFNGVRAAQLQIGNENNCAWYNQDDLTFYTDNVHFDSASQNKIGERVADLIINNSLHTNL